MPYRSLCSGLVCLSFIVGGCTDDPSGGVDTEAATDSGDGDTATPPTGSDSGDSTAAQDASGSDSGESTVSPPDTSSGGSESDSDSGAAPEHLDLFACRGLTPSCEQMTQHIDPEPAEAVECAGQLIASGQPGILSALDAPGPDIDETEFLIVVIGDGTALVQTRERSCDENDLDCSYATLEWEPSGEHQLCTLVIDPNLQAACDPACATECACGWHPFFGDLGDCQLVEDWTCEDAAATLRTR